MPETKKIRAGISFRVQALQYEPMEISASVEMDVPSATSQDAWESLFKEVQEQASAKLVEAVAAFRKIRAQM